MSLTLPQRLARRCVHFTGTMEKVCNAGIVYDDLPGPGLPCLQDDRAAPCELAQFPTPETVAAQIAEMQAASERRRVIREAIIAASPRPFSVQGSIICPCCGGTVDFSIASNGHVWARCSTSGCAGWME